MSILRTSDNRMYSAPNLFPIGYLTQFVGVADDVTNGVEGEGNLLTLSSEEVETAELDFQFIKKFYLAGGSASWKGAVVGDWIKFELHAPATPGISNEGAGAYDKYPIGGGINLFIPNATTEGDWDLNLTEKLNSNVDFTKVVPVPAAGGNTGFFDWDQDTGAVTLNTEQKGRYNLFDSIMPMHEFVKKVPLLGDSVEPFTVPAVKPYLCLPHWHIKLSAYNSTVKRLDVAAFIYRGVL